MIQIINAIYHFLRSLGYPHPIHPALTHMPIGLVVGALFFGGYAWFFRRERLALTARHCHILALIFLVPSVLAGLMDWQHFYHGAWLLIFKLKMAMAGTLFVLLIVSLIISQRDEKRYAILLPIYGVCFGTVVILGFLGGQLVFGGMAPVAHSKELKVGEELFRSHCAACHPQGRNVFFPKLPLIGSHQLDKLETFRAFVRHPVLPNGSRGPMPPFPTAELSDPQIKDLYAYITQVLAPSENK